ncbi:MAG: antibiotic biosynthesis monooxygenase [Ruminococcaceae bacterium]|jgi:quinol monooxygenase YgiN|nr:antibiotic biosynthesis monooxygenase [Oscillospiraceae bacterium]
MKETYLFVTYITKPGQRETFLREMAERGVTEAIRAEDGCLQYDYYLSIQNENEILLAERWTSPEKQQVHMGQPHMTHITELKEKYVESTTLRWMSEEDHAV